MSYDFKEVSLSIWIEQFLLEKIFHFKCDYLSYFNHLNLQWKLYFSKICNMHLFKLFCPSGLNIVAHQVTLQGANFSHRFLTIQL